MTVYILTLLKLFEWPSCRIEFSISGLRILAVWRVKNQQWSTHIQKCEILEVSLAPLAQGTCDAISQSVNSYSLASQGMCLALSVDSMYYRHGVLRCWFGQQLFDLHLGL